jgi:hypothetical protein
VFGHPIQATLGGVIILRIAPVKELVRKVRIDSTGRVLGSSNLELLRDSKVLLVESLDFPLKLDTRPNVEVRDNTDNGNLVVDLFLKGLAHHLGDLGRAKDNPLVLAARHFFFLVFSWFVRREEKGRDERGEKKNFIFP